MEGFTSLYYQSHRSQRGNLQTQQSRFPHDRTPHPICPSLKSSLWVSWRRAKPKVVQFLEVSSFAWRHSLSSSYLGWRGGRVRSPGGTNRCLPRLVGTLKDPNGLHQIWLAWRYPLSGTSISQTHPFTSSLRQLGQHLWSCSCSYQARRKRWSRILGRSCWAPHRWRGTPHWWKNCSWFILKSLFDRLHDSFCTYCS